MTLAPPPGSPDHSAVDALFEDSYRELRRIAHARLRRNERVTLLDTTSLVHECYLRLSRVNLPDLRSPGDCMAYVASVMRSVIVDFVRRRHALRSGGVQSRQSFDTQAGVATASVEQNLLDIEEALTSLATVAPRLAKVVEMKYFGGFTEAEIAGSLGTNERTVRRDWDKARSLLRATLQR